MVQKRNRKKYFLIAFDTLFIMILCFATLLSAMLMQGEVIGKMKYSINWITFILTLFSLVIYLCFVLLQSDKGLRTMVKHLYKESKIIK